MIRDGPSAAAELQDPFSKERQSSPDALGLQNFFLEEILWILIYLFGGISV
jgi:hypothetical protein